MKIGGIQKTTLIDYPGKIACTVFLAGCNFRCPWCYSKELVLPEEIEKQPEFSEEKLFDFLKKRKGLLGGVVVCGGEPTVNRELPQLVKKIKDLGFEVKLDTNGSNSEMLKKMIEDNLVDYVAMDIKLPKRRYSEVFHKENKIKEIEESIKFLKKGKVDYEFRTTVVPTVLEKEDILKIAKWIKGAEKYYLQSFKAEKTINPEFEKVKPYSGEKMKEFQKAVSSFVKKCEIR